MGISASHIGQSTVKITNDVKIESGELMQLDSVKWEENMVPFMTFANAIADAVTGASAGFTKDSVPYAGQTPVYAKIRSTDMKTVLTDTVNYAVSGKEYRTTYATLTAVPSLTSALSLEDGSTVTLSASDIGTLLRTTDGKWYLYAKPAGATVASLFLYAKDLPFEYIPGFEPQQGKVVTSKLYKEQPVIDEYQAINASSYITTALGTGDLAAWQQIKSDLTAVPALGSTISCNVNINQSTFVKFGGKLKLSTTDIFPAVGETSKTYLETSTGYYYLWNGAGYVKTSFIPTKSTWELFDSFWGFEDEDEKAGQSLGSSIYTQIFRAPNADGVSYKNIAIRYDTLKMEINTSTYEDFIIKHTVTSTADSSFEERTYSSTYSHRSDNPLLDTVFKGKTKDLINYVYTKKRIATNESWSFGNCAPIGYNLTYCDMLVMVSPRWLVLHSYLNEEPSLWAGVFENIREDVMDVPEGNNPCWGWISSTLWLLGAFKSGNNVGGTPLKGTDHTLWAMPKTKQGNAGLSAAKTWGADYGATFHPHWLNSTVGSFIYYLGNTVGEGNRFTTSGWDPTRKLAMPIKPISDYKSNALINYGGIFGIKVLAPAGANMNKIIIPTDKDGNSSPTGDKRFHWLLNNHYKQDASFTNSWAGNTTWAYAPYAMSGSSPRPLDMVNTGNALYVITAPVSGSPIFGNKVVRINTKTAEQLDLVVTSGKPRGTDKASDVLGNEFFRQVIFDGERYIYILTTANKVLKFDTATDKVCFIGVIPAGQSVGAAFYTFSNVNYIALTGKYLITITSNGAINFYAKARFSQPTLAINTAATDGVTGPNIQLNATGNLKLADGVTTHPNATTVGPWISTTVGTNMTVVDSTLDYSGNLWAITAGTPGSNDTRLIRIGGEKAASGWNLAAYGYSVASPSATYPFITQAGIQSLDDENIVIWLATSADINNIFGYLGMYQFNPKACLETPATKAPGVLTGSTVTQLNVKVAALGTSQLYGTANVAANPSTTGYVRLTYAKIDGVLFVMPRNAASGSNQNYCFSLPLGWYTDAYGTLDVPVRGSNQWGESLVKGYNAFSGTDFASFIFYDGARIYSNNDSALKVYTNVHGTTAQGGAVINATTVGQVAIPA